MTDLTHPILRLFSVYPDWIDLELAAFTVLSGIAAGASVGFMMYPASFHWYVVPAWMLLGPIFLYPMFHFMSGRGWSDPDE